MMWNCPPTRILVAVDFGDPALAAVRVAASLARRTSARLTALHAEALEAPPYFTAEQIALIESQRAAARAAAEHHLRAVVEREAGVPVDAVVVDGPATEAIVAAATETDLLVVGTHGRRGPSRWWLGSVAERVARAAAVPVLIVHDGATASDVFVRPVVLDTGSGPSRALQCARQLATSAGGDVQVVPAADAAHTVPALGATAVVMSRAPEGATHALPAAGPALIRDCRLPILIIPEEQS